MKAFDLIWLRGKRNMNILTVVDEGEEEEEDDVDDYPHALRNADYVPQTSE